MNSSFAMILAKIDSQVKKFDIALKNTWCMYNIGNMELSYEVALRLEDVSERITLLTRMLPACTGNPLAAQAVDEAMMKAIPVDIGFTREGWFSLRMPMLLPKKTTGSPAYVRAFLYPAMRDFFVGKTPVRYTDCVLIYRHVYSKSRPERQRRDHDNIEINMVSDIVALYVMEDDGATSCRHYYCSAGGTEERTEVYVVPYFDFGRWLEMEKGAPDEGVKLYPERTSPTEKDMFK